jgi:uncharacterized protein (TIGR02246 family)
MTRSSPQPVRSVGRAVRATASAVIVVALLMLANRATTLAAPGYELVAVQSAIDAANRAYVAALVKKDAKAFGDLFTVDAVSLPARSPAVHGRDAIVESMRGVFRHLTFERGRLRTLETHLDGDVASEIGSYEFDVLVDGNAETLQGRYLVVWRAVDGVWKIAIDSSQPGAPTG